MRCTNLSYSRGMLNVAGSARYGRATTDQEKERDDCELHSQLKRKADRREASVSSGKLNDTFMNFIGQLLSMT